MALFQWSGWFRGKPGPTAEAVNLTGPWAGHYWQHGTTHPIVAEFVQKGDRLTGTMRDGDTAAEWSLFDVAAEAGLPPGADEQIAAQLQALLPGASGTPIRYEAQLPAVSVLEGEVRQREVMFFKTYQGEHFTGYRIGDRRVGAMIVGHTVQYAGTLNEAGTAIEGRWRIPPPQPGEPGTEGDFVLRRQPGGDE